MSTSLYPLLFVVGFLAAAFTVSRILHWVSLTRVSIGKLGGDFLGAPKRRLIWATPFILLFHPGLYLLLGLLAIAVLAISGQLPAAWRWFVAGFCAYALLGGLLVLKALRKRRSRQSQQSKLDEPVLDRQGQSPRGHLDRPLPEGIYFLVHSAAEKVLAWCMLSTIAVLTLVGIYFVWSASGVGGELYIISVGGLCGWASALYLRRVYNRIELTAMGIRQRRFNLDVFIPWSEIARITEAPFPTAVLIHGQSGTTVRLDKTMVGLPIVFTYFQEFLSPQLNSSATDASCSCPRKRCP
ncbi:MAG TPA: hypothetical protein VJ738_03270 [Steroidobacteraceae bacterium]|nr:hypothetical protein [Steroidobacteraceae bacterium]